MLHILNDDIDSKAQCLQDMKELSLTWPWHTTDQQYDLRLLISVCMRRSLLISCVTHLAMNPIA